MPPDGGADTPGGGSEGPGFAAEFGCWFVEYLAQATPADAAAQEEFVQLVELVTDWCMERLSTEERVELVYLLEDPDLEFASPFVAELIPQIIAALLQ